MKPPGQRVVSVFARCQQCQVPVYYSLKDDDVYNVFLVRFHIRGGDGYSFEPLAHSKFGQYAKLLLQLHVSDSSFDRGADCKLTTMPCN